MSRMHEASREFGSLAKFHPMDLLPPADLCHDNIHAPSILEDIERGLISAATAGEIADVVVDSVITTMVAECCRLDQVIDSESAIFRTLSVRSASGTVPAVDERVPQWVIRNRTTLRHPDAACTGDPRVQSLLSVPVNHGDRTIAVLTLTSPERDVFSGHDERMLLDAATLAGDALDRVRRSAEYYNARRAHIEQELAECKDRLVQSERLSSVGRLMAGIVHELNSPLTAILGFAQVISRTEGRSGPLDKIIAESERCARIVRSVLRVSGSGAAGGRETIDVHGGIRQAVELVSFQRELQRIDLEVDLSPSDPRITANPCEFVQVMLNLLMNAVQAVIEDCGKEGGEDGGKGVIDVRSRVESDRVVVTIRDDGPGMDARTVGRIFEPFFTTKRSGTGLGLSLSKQLVEENGGTIRVQSRPGKGTTFSLSFPLSVAASEQENESQPTRILVVDDEARILELMEAVLSRPGFEVRCVESGDKAVGELADSRFDLLISDMRMPGMDGTELVSWARENRAADHVLLLTGDIANGDLNRIAKELGGECLRKPFRIEELLTAVDHALEARQSAPGPN